MSKLRDRQMSTGTRWYSTKRDETRCKLEIYIGYFMESAGVRYLRTSCWRVRNRTSERSERVRFLIQKQRVRIYRTKHFPWLGPLEKYVTIAQSKSLDFLSHEEFRIAGWFLKRFILPFLCRDDLALGHKANSWYKQMEAVCLGDSSVNIRAREPEKDLSVESQVACLMDHAMDPNILGRTYGGWEPWMWSGSVCGK